MNLRHLVPALAIAAVSVPAFAADVAPVAPAVSFAGWSDNILTVRTTDVDDTPGTAQDESGTTIRFSAQASLKAMWKVTDALSAKVNLWFDAGTAEVNMREGYFAWAFNDSVTWSMGKYIDHIGWISAEPTGLYTVNNSLIGYLQTYGNDVLGTSIAVAPKGSPLSGSFHVVNGYYTESDGSNGAPSVNRENSDLGFGLDLTYAFPDNKGNLNLEFAYDLHSAFNANVPGDLGGDVFLAGLNATVTPIKPLLIGAEIQYMTIGKGENGAGADIGEDIKRTQGLLLVNYALSGTSFPMSISGEVQYATIDYNTPDDEKRLGVQAALLTNPLGSSNFGLNFEVGYFDIKDSQDVDFGTDKGVVVSVEGLVTF